MFNFNWDEFKRFIKEAIREAFSEYAKSTPQVHDLMTVAKAAKYCDVSKSTVENWIAEGAIRAGQYGRVKRVKRSDLHALLGLD